MVSLKFAEKQMQVHRLRLAQKTRQSPLRMTGCFDVSFRLGTIETILMGGVDIAPP
jgi:hypothetical protein